MLHTETAIRILDGSQARTSLLRRQRFDHAAITPGMAAGIRRVFGADLTPTQVVDRILADVRASGDAALRDYTQRLDGVTLDALAVTPTEIDDAWDETPRDLRNALQLAA